MLNQRYKFIAGLIQSDFQLQNQQMVSIKPKEVLGFATKGTGREVYHGSIHYYLSDDNRRMISFERTHKKLPGGQERFAIFTSGKSANTSCDPSAPYEEGAAVTTDEGQPAQQSISTSSVGKRMIPSWYKSQSSS